VRRGQAVVANASRYKLNVRSRESAVAVGLALLALLIPYVAVKLVVLTVIVVGLIIAVLVR
jgi:hypothetical protein